MPINPRRSATLALTVVLLSIAACRRADLPPAPADAGDSKTTLRFFRDPPAMPPFTVTTLDGKTLNSSAFAGKVLLINFWATWCGPCRAEIPDLIALQAKYRDQLQIIGISHDEGPVELVRRFIDGFEVNYPVAMSTPELDKAFPGIAALPTSFLVNRQGRIVQRHVGMLTALTTELETRALAGLPVNATIEEIDRAQPLKLGTSAQALEIPGVNLSSLPVARRVEAIQKLNSEPCTCGCGLSIARCRVEDPSCGVSLPMAQQIVDEIGGRVP